MGEPPVPPLDAAEMEKLMAAVMSNPELIHTIPDEYVDQLLTAFGVSPAEIEKALSRFRNMMLRNAPVRGNA